MSNVHKELEQSTIRGWWNRVPPAQRRILPVAFLVFILIIAWQIPTCVQDRAQAEDTLSAFVSDANLSEPTSVYNQYLAEGFYDEQKAAKMLESNRDALSRAVGIQVNCTNSSGALSAPSSGPIVNVRGSLIYPANETGPDFEAEMIRSAETWRISRILIGSGARGC